MSLNVKKEKYLKLYDLSLLEHLLKIAVATEKRSQFHKESMF